ncbi:oxidoreductase [Hoyosella rhizosphaerae]|nr:oxidoreductase [Hoyosella rhizosphaerae]MBN4925356.1 oxidoreductase [Hoyosella rhizosphaerae]
MSGIRDAAERARSVLGEAHRHNANRREWAKSATEASVRAARASSALDGGKTELDGTGDVQDPTLAGSLRVSQALDGESLENMVKVWKRAPLQVLAKLHMLAAADLVENTDALGRPRQTPDVGERLELLAHIVTGGTKAPAPVIAAVVHGELLALRPFGTADGVVARAASRLVAVASGLDPHNLGVPESSWLQRASAYRSAAKGFATGTEQGVGNWVILCCGALEAGGREAINIADAAAAAKK